MKNIGTVVYTKWLEKGSLKARWTHSESGGGVGEAFGGPEIGFCGDYTIIYTDEEGSKSPEFELNISQADESYQLTWKTNGKLVSIGYGMLVGEQLVAGWKDV